MVCEMVLTEYKKRLVCVCIFIFCFISLFPYRKINVNKIKYVMDSQNRAMDMEDEKRYHYTPEEVFSLFQCLTSRIENGHPNILELGEDKDHFFRGEIHMLRMIGVDPGIHSSELARKFGVSRAVTAKTIQKLLKKGVIERLMDAQDQKIYDLYLTEKGRQVVEDHEAYHQQLDQELYKHVEHMKEPDLKVITEFLEYANNLVKNHY